MATGPGKKTPRFCASIESTRGLTDGRLQLVLSGIHPQGGSKTIEGKAIWVWDLPPANHQALPGRQVCLTRPIIPVHGFYNYPVSLFDETRRTQGIHWRTWSRENKGEPAFSGEPDYFQALRTKLLGRLLSLLDLPAENASQATNAKALLPALLFGDRFYLSQATADNFSLAAIAHSLALSGQHLAIAGLLGLFCIVTTARFQPTIYLCRPRLVLVAIASCPAALLYLWIGNAPPSLLRAACMMFALCFLVAGARIFSGLDVIFTAMAIFLLFSPMSFLEVGLQLSFLCILSIAAFLPGLKTIWPFKHKKNRKPSFLGRFFQILAISLLVQISLLPITLKYFGLAGLWFPLNAIWLPVLGLVVLPCAVAGLFCATMPFAATEWLARQMFALAVWPCQMLCEGLEYMRHCGLLAEPVFQRPHWTVMVAFVLIMCGLAMLTCRRKTSLCVKMLSIGLVFLAFGPCLRIWGIFEGKTTLDIIDVGQGQAICLNFPGGERLLIDGGGSNSSRFDPGKALLAPVLFDNAAPRLAGIVNSHPDMDHLGGLLYLLEKIDTGMIFHNGREAAGRLKDLWARARKESEAIVLAKGDRLEAGGGLYLEVLHPPAAEPKWSGNNASIILRLCRDGEGLALVPGDAEIESLKALLASGADIAAKVLIAPHHGSNSSFLPAFLKKVHPELIVAACGFRNRYAYPGKKLREWGAKNGVPILNTGDNGRTGIDFGRDGKIRVKTTLSGI